jgi:hypothetical protein
MTTLRTTLVAVFTLGFIAATSPAQTPSPCGVATPGLSIYGAFPKTGAPFSATVQTTHEEKFVGGNAIHGQIVTHYYRDSAGRVRMETSTRCDIGADGQFRPLIDISVNDPVARTTLHWRVNDTGEKVARFYHQPAPQPAPTAAPLTEEQRKQNALVQAHWNKNTRKETLGTRMITGFLTDGNRQTTTTPAGEQGNEKAIDLMEEYWVARDTGIAMLHIEDEPRVGRITVEVTDLKLAEPDPSLFAPPPDYKLEEQVTTIKPAAQVAAQSAGASVPTEIAPCTPEIKNWVGPTPVGGMKNAPFSATGKLMVDQKLPGGNAIHGVYLSRTMRDSAGRARVETVKRCWRGADGNFHAAWTVVVMDHVTETRLTWDIDDLEPKVVHLTHFSVANRPPPPTPEQIAQQKKMSELNQPPQGELKDEDLGTKNINGVSADGKRTTRTVPAGEEGNDRPLTTVHEVWFSKQLGQMVMTIDDDPRGSDMVFALENIKLQEPDASLFAAPAGYSVEEIKPAK